jgi:FAD/FMN-containing dehydrogenase
MMDKSMLEKIVGADRVSDQHDELDMYSTDQSFVHPIRPKYVVQPESLDHIQGIIKLANETLTPLVPVSSGGPHFRGDTVPSDGGAVIVDLSRMKEIIRTDPDHRITMVQPGVKYRDLIPELKKDGLRLNLPLLPRATKSVVGSLLEREPVIMPRYHWDISDPIACTEIIYGSGDYFRTGSSAGPGSVEEQWEAGAAQNEAAGPLQADFVRFVQGAQGTIGIVSWATVRCERIPSIEEPFLIGSDNLNNLLEFGHWAIRRRIVDKCFILNSINFNHIRSNDQNGGIQASGNASHTWVLFFSIAGYKYFPEERIHYLKNATDELAKTSNLEPLRTLGGSSAYELLHQLENVSEDPYWKMKAKGSCYDLFFLSISKKLDGFVNTMHRIVDQYEMNSSDLGIYIQPIVQGTSYHCEFNLFYDPNNMGEREKVKNLADRAVIELMNEGAFFSRPYGSWADPVYRRDAQTTIQLRKLKAIFDPNNIMNPGKLCFI